MRSRLVRFALTFFLSVLAFSVLSVVTNLQDHLHHVENAIAGSATWMAQSTGSAATVADNLITVNGLSLNINHECTGVFVLFVLASFVGAYPARWRAKVAGIVVGVSLLSLINVIRIATLVRVVEFYPALFTYFHEYVWQGAFLMLVTLCAVTWVEWVRRKDWRKVFSGPGECEVEGVFITGVRTFDGKDSSGEAEPNTVFMFEFSDLTICHLGDLGHVLTESQVEALPGIDVLLVPVGGRHTLDASMAAEVLSIIEPRIVVPMHSRLPGTPEHLEPIDRFLKEMRVPAPEPVSVLKLAKGQLPEETQVVVMEVK